MVRARKISTGAGPRKSEKRRPKAGAGSAEIGAVGGEPGGRDTILDLQRAAGNQGVRRILDARERSPGPDQPPTRSATSGQPLPMGLRADFERLFSMPLGDVRVHTDAAAAASAEDQGAEAYAIGSQVVFGEDGYAPHTSDGRTLLAHEIAHVVQQARGAHQGVVTAPGSGAEQDAAAAAGAVARGSAPQVSAVTGIGIARSEEDEKKKPDAKAKPKPEKSAPPTTEGATKETPPKAKSGGKKAPPEPEIVGEYQGVPVKRYPPKGNAPKQRTYVKPSVPEELPEGTHGVVDSPPGSGKVRPETEAGNWAHTNFEKMESIIKPEAEQLTSEKLPAGLRKEVEVPDPRLPPGKRPRIDRVNDATGEIIEIKPEGLRQQGQVEADAYAEQMNKFEKRSDGKKWVGRVVTYDEKKVREFLRQKGYTDPDAAPPAKKGPGKGGKAKAKSPKAQQPKGGAKASSDPGTAAPTSKPAPAPGPSAISPQIRKKAPPPAPNAPAVKPKPAAPVAEGLATMPRAKVPVVEPAPGPLTVPRSGGVSKAPAVTPTPKVPTAPQRGSFTSPRIPSFRGAITSGIAGAAAALLMMWLSSKLDVTGDWIQADIEKRSKAIEDSINAQEAYAIALFAADPSKPVYANILVTLEFWGANEAEPTGPVPIESYAGISSIAVTLSRDNPERYIEVGRDYNWSRPFMWERHPMILFSVDLGMVPMSLSRE